MLGAEPSSRPLDRAHSLPAPAGRCSVPNDQESNRAGPVGCDDADRTHSDGHPLLGAETPERRAGTLGLQPPSSRLAASQWLHAGEGAMLVAGELGLTIAVC